MHVFKHQNEQLEKNLNEKSNEISNKPTRTTDSNIYSDFMSSLVSVYLDTHLQFKAIDQQSSQLDAHTNKSKLEEVLCLNAFYLLGMCLFFNCIIWMFWWFSFKDSCVYYVCNCVLQMNSLSESNISYLVPILR